MSEVVGLVVGLTVISIIGSALTDIIRAQNLPGTIENVVIPSVQPEVVYINPPRQVIIRQNPTIYISHNHNKERRERKKRRREQREKSVKVKD